MFEDLIKKKESAEKVIKKILKNEESKAAERIQKKINKIWGNKGLGKAQEPVVKKGKTYRIPK